MTKGDYATSCSSGDAGLDGNRNFKWVNPNEAEEVNGGLAEPTHVHTYADTGVDVHRTKDKGRKKERA